MFFFKFSCWSKFHVNIITSSRVMTIFFCKGLTRNLEIGNTPIWILPNIWRLGQVRNSKFVTNVFNEILLHAAKYQIYSFYRFWVIKGKLAGWWKNYPLCFPLRGTQSASYPYLQSGLDVFKINLTDLIQVSIEAFWHSYTWYLKHLRMRKLQLFINKYYLQVFWHDMDFKHTMGILFDIWSLSMTLSTWSCDFF